jgi:hypothetical protein
MKAKIGELVLLGLLGFSVIVAVDGSVSIVHV